VLTKKQRERKMVTKERDEELALFLQMRRREMDAEELHTPSPAGQVFSSGSESILVNLLLLKALST